MEGDPTLLTPAWLTVALTVILAIERLLKYLIKFMSTIKQSSCEASLTSCCRTGMDYKAKEENPSAPADNESNEELNDK